MKNHYRSFTAALAALCLAGAAHTHAQEVSAVMTNAEGGASVSGNVSASNLLAGDTVVSGSYYLGANIVGQPNGAFYWRDGEVFHGAIGLADSSAPTMFAWMRDLVPGDGVGEWAPQWFTLRTDGNLKLNVPLVTVAGAITTTRQIESAGAPVARWRGSGTSDPASPVNGDLFLRTDTSKVRIYAGGSWINLN